MSDYHLACQDFTKLHSSYQVGRLPSYRRVVEASNLSKMSFISDILEKTGTELGSINSLVHFSINYE